MLSTHQSSPLSSGPFLKRASWKRQYSFDFSHFGEFHGQPAESGIQGVNYIITSDLDQELTLTVLGQIVVGKVVQLLIGGGEPGATYYIDVSITTEPHKYIVSGEGVIRVVP